MKRKDIVDTINRLSGVAGHTEVLKVYNNQKPLPRGYTVKWQDAWCATTVSAVFLMNGYKDISECSCPKMVEKAKALGIWVENDNYMPKKGDIVLYDWQDSGKGDNKGTPDHVGIVISANANSFIVREGNKGGTIGNRLLARNSMYIRGFITPPYEKEKTKSEQDIVTEVIEGKWGEGSERQKRLTEAGYDYSRIQSLVNIRISNYVKNAESYYTVQKGDNLTMIAKKFKVSIIQIKKLNNIKDINKIYVGQKLRIK